MLSEDLNNCIVQFFVENGLKSTVLSESHEDSFCQFDSVIYRYDIYWRGNFHGQFFELEPKYVDAPPPEIMSLPEFEYTLTLWPSYEKMDEGMLRDRSLIASLNFQEPGSFGLMKNILEGKQVSITPNPDSRKHLCLADSTKIVGLGINDPNFEDGKYLLMECSLCKKLLKKQMPWVLRRNINDYRKGMAW